MTVDPPTCLKPSLRCTRRLPSLPTNACDEIFRTPAVGTAKSSISVFSASVMSPFPTWSGCIMSANLQRANARRKRNILLQPKVQTISGWPAGREAFSFDNVSRRAGSCVSSKDVSRPSPKSPAYPDSTASRSMGVSSDARVRMTENGTPGHTPVRRHSSKMSRARLSCRFVQLCSCSTTAPIAELSSR